MIDRDKFPFDYDSLLGELSGEKIILVLGGIDTGKTTLIRALHEDIGGEVIDGDVGQPEIGPPGIISRGTYGDGLEDGYFVGDITPRDNLVQVVGGISKMAKDCDLPCFVDTDGWVEGGAAGVYKSELIELLEPDKVILLEKENELENFCSQISEERMVRLNAQTLRGKSPGERAANRARRFKYYFFRGKCFFKSWDSVKVGGSLVDLKGRRELETGRHKNRLAGCYRGFDFECLGIIREVRSEGIEVYTLSKKFDTLKLGKIKVEPSGRQIE